MPDGIDTGFANFQRTLSDLTEAFERDYPRIKEHQLDEANLRLLYINPLFEALGWDIHNRCRQPLHSREVIVEPPMMIGRRQKRPDYLFRIGGIDKFTIEAKRPRTVITQHFYQAQNYVYNLRIWVGVLCDFEHFIVFVVGGQPTRERPFPPINGWRLHYRDYVANARRLWEYFARDNVAAGSIDRLAQEQEKIPARGRQGWLIKPDRSRAVDADFLAYLEDSRKGLARHLHKAALNERVDLTEATQRIIDRILFQRICEDRGIDVGVPLATTVDRWRDRGRLAGQLWPALVANFQHLKRAFNGGIYGRAGDPPHAVDSLAVPDRWLMDFIETLSAEDGQYLFRIIPVDILGSVYERFLGSTVQPNGNVERKPEVRKAGGVYYTPRPVVDYIVDATLTPLLKGKTPEETRTLKVLDPACGSGSFLLRAFERICEHHIEWYSSHGFDERACYRDAHGDLRLTTAWKRRILTDNIFGMDIDPQAVEVTQMSLFLKTLEDETTESLRRDRTLFPTETHLPDLSTNIKCGNSLVDLNFDVVTGAAPERVAEVNPCSWVAEFPKVMRRGGGFHAIIGNPPYVRPHHIEADIKEYLWSDYLTFVRKADLYCAFVERSLRLTRSGGRVGMILSNSFLHLDSFEALRDFILKNAQIETIINFRKNVFQDASVRTCIIVLARN